MIERKKKKAKEKRVIELLLEALKTKENDPTQNEPSEGTSADRAPQPPPIIETTDDVVIAPSEVEADPRKRHRSQDDIVQTYVPRWGVLVSDATACPAPDPAKDIGTDVCKGLMLPRDAPTYAKAEPLEACTELMALLTMVGFFGLYFYLYIFFFSF